VVWAWGGPFFWGKKIRPRGPPNGAGDELGLKALALKFFDREEIGLFGCPARISLGLIPPWLPWNRLFPQRDDRRSRFSIPRQFSASIAPTFEPRQSRRWPIVLLQENPHGGGADMQAPVPRQHGKLGARTGESRSKSSGAHGFQGGRWRKFYILNLIASAPPCGFLLMRLSRSLQAACEGALALVGGCQPRGWKAQPRETCKSGAGRKRSGDHSGAQTRSTCPAPDPARIKPRRCEADHRLDTVTPSPVSAKTGWGWQAQSCRRVGGSGAAAAGSAPSLAVECP